MMRRASIGQGLSVFFRLNKTYFTSTIPPPAAILVSVIYLTISQIVRYIPKPYKDACVLASEPLTAFFLRSLSSAHHRFCIVFFHYRPLILCQMYQRKRTRSRLNLSPVQPNLSSQHLLEHLSLQSLPLLERLTPQSRSLQDRLSPQSRPLLECFEPLPLQDRLSLGSQNLPIEVPLPQRLAPRTKQSKAKARLRKKSLLERMNVELSSKGSSLSLLSTETDKSLKRRHSWASSPSSSGSRSPSPKRTRLSSLTPRSSSPSVETMSPTPHGWLEVD